MPAEFFWSLQIGSIKKTKTKKTQNKKKNTQKNLKTPNKSPKVSLLSAVKNHRFQQKQKGQCWELLKILSLVVFFLFFPPHVCLLDPYRVRGQRKHHHERRGFLLNFLLVLISKHIKKMVVVRLPVQGGSGTFCLLCNFNWELLFFLVPEDFLKQVMSLKKNKT